MMTWIRHNPVAALTTLYTILATVDGVLIGTHALPTGVITALTGVVAVLAAVLGAITHTKVTPLIEPKAADRTPLVPLVKSYPPNARGA